MCMKQVTVTTVWRGSCWQRGQCDRSHASGLTASIIPNDFSSVPWSYLLLTHCCFRWLMMKLRSSPLHRAVSSTWPAALVSICLCNNGTHHLAWVWSKTIIDSPALKFTGLIQFCGTPRQWLTLPLAWFVNWVNVPGIGRTNLNCTINLLVLVKCVEVSSSSFTFVFFFFPKKASGLRLNL